jgi:hypothetical protein
MVNGLKTIRIYGREQHFVNNLCDMLDAQTGTLVTSNGINRWSAFRIDLQAYLIATLFAFFAMFVKTNENKTDLALMAIGF